MNEYELSDVWLGHMHFLVTVFVAFLSATSALLIVANLKGKDLQPAVFKLVMYLYSVSAIFFVLFFTKVSESRFYVRGQMVEAGLVWFNAVYEAEFVLFLLLGMGILIMISLAVGSVWYFISTRRN